MCFHFLISDNNFFFFFVIIMTSISTFLSIKVNANKTIDVDRERIKEIQTRFNQLSIGQVREDDDVKKECINKLIEEFQLLEDNLCLEYLDVCVSEDSPSDAAWEIESRARDKPVDAQTLIKESIQPTVTITSAEISSSTMTTTTMGLESNVVSGSSESDQDKKVTPIGKIVCIIHQKSTKIEVKEFLRTFLFRQANENSTPLCESGHVHPILDGNVHPLDPGSILDLFIRQQMADRETVTLAPSTTRCRLVEPISLTDEFESWRFDHFRGLLDFWLAMDGKCQQALPVLWALTPNAKIEYIVATRVISGDDDPSAKQSERPSTKSIANFLRDICRIEGNKMYDKWYKALVNEENIATYAHLTNLNQKEWEKISKLPMNALKTIKFYVDQEKQMVEERKTKKVPQEQQPVEDKSYSKAEIRANLHMIKLYIIRQLEDQEGIEPIPLLEAFCVERAFEEMHAEGYEDDGLFREMKLFFQSLTVADEELIIDKQTLTQVERDQFDEAEKLRKDVLSLKERCRDKQRQIAELTKRIDEIKLQRIEIFSKYQEEQGDEDIGSEDRELSTVHWAEEEARLMDEQNEKTSFRAKSEGEFHQLEIERMTKANRVKTIDDMFAENKTTIDRRLVKPHRGFIMYGPPGTGKSVIMSKLAKKVGIAMVGPPLAAGELERPYVGQSEAIILDLCMRANRLPHLICCVSIDEIDSLAPKRDEDSSEGKVAKISVLLSVIEGIKDVPNLMFFSATNRLHMMDEAFLRRMSGKFFVGRPSAAARRRILDGIPKIILQPYIREKLATATTNFSGAALKALTSAITVDYIAKRRLCATYEMQEDEALILADRTARQFQLFLGLDTLPRLLLYNLDDQRRFSETQTTTTTTIGQKEPLPMGFHLPDDYQFTGKILISLTDQCARLEILQNDNTRRTIEEPLTKGEQSLQQLLERITSYGNDRNVQLLQLIDLNLLSSKGAHDEKKIFETLKERYDECMEYKRSMIVYDLDSLIGVNKSESESSMGTSVSSSVVNQSIYIYVTSRFREAKIEAKRSDQKMSIERWAIAVVRDDFLLKKFTTDVDFMLTDQQKSDDENHRKRSKDLLFCVKCRDHFVETENKMGACTYHDGFLYDNSALDLKMYKPSQATEILYAEESIAVKDQTKKDEMERGKTRFKYICCHATFQVGAGMNGCRKGEHGREKDEDGWEKVKIDARLYKAIKIGITKWEKDCFEDIGYNLKLIDLLQSRKK